jgi:hypothetical protein
MYQLYLFYGDEIFMCVMQFEFLVADANEEVLLDYHWCVH